MSPEEKEKLKRFRVLGVREGTPKDLSVAIQSFIDQAIITGENNLDFMPPEYVEKLLKVMSKYPEYNNVTLSLLSILKKGDLL